MLVLSRKSSQQIEIGDDIVLTVLSLNRGRVRLGISAPREITVRRSELSVEQENEELELAFRGGSLRKPR